MALHKLIDVYPYRLQSPQRLEFLLFKRAQNMMYAGQWRMVGGKVELGETYAHAAKRELMEETGLLHFQMWSVPTINQFYDPSTDAIRTAVPFAAQVDGQKTIVLNHEHSEFAWLDVHEAIKRIVWPEQIRIMNIIQEWAVQRSVPDDWWLPC